MKFKRLTIVFLLSLFCNEFFAQSYQPQFSTAGFYAVNESPRKVFSMNPTWRFYKGALDSVPLSIDFDDSKWEAVSLPHGLEVLPTEQSGCSNYQGVAWYRKRFEMPLSGVHEKVILYFEAIMGKSKIWLNGVLIAEQFGGFLPISIDVTKSVKRGVMNQLVVMTDNSNDPMYPPGKSQETLDFNYSGGIYRDVWLVVHKEVFVTDPNRESVEAGGGLFLATKHLTAKEAAVSIRLHLRNDSKNGFKGRYLFEMIDPSTQKVVSKSSSPFVLPSSNASTFEHSMRVPNPICWTPDRPHLYHFKVTISDSKGLVVDSYYQRFGIRTIEFRGTEGFFLNGSLYPRPLMGANRHQDFAVVGNALSNSMHWRDAKKLKDCGLELIRNAHYPQDPAFMDACDELGLLVIVNTPGWQFWNKDPLFEQRVYADIRQMIRRDRNRASLFLWEPILNETYYPDYFAKRVYEITMAETPLVLNYAASDYSAKGSEHFPVIFTHPIKKETKEHATSAYKPNISYYTREWGDCVDSWSSHNSPSRVSRSWGEQAQLVQAQHYAQPPYSHTSMSSFYEYYPEVFGGALWHSFDHQRGYHPDPFYGGIMDAFRQPKYSYYMFMSQRSAQVNNASIAETGAMVYIAHEMTPFSSAEVVVYSNCDEVRLSAWGGRKVYHYKRPINNSKGIPSPIIKFADVYDFMIDKRMTMNEGKADSVFFLAEGLIGGKVVATHRVAPARRPTKLVLTVDNEATDLRADGSDMVVVVASLCDDKGVVKRLTNHIVSFEIEGEGALVGQGEWGITSKRLEWGEAPVLVRSTLREGVIKVRARMYLEGKQMPLSGEIELRSLPAAQPLVIDQTAAADLNRVEAIVDRPVPTQEVETFRKELNRIKLKEVEDQQKDFGE